MTTVLNEILDQDTSEDRIAVLVDEIKRSAGQRDVLVDLLPEENPVYRGRGTNQTIRMRGYILAAFEQTGLPEQALPFVLAELENGRDAYLVAAAAKALRGMEHPSTEFIPFLFRAINNIRDMDDALTFEQYKPSWPVTGHTSALQEILRSFQWLDAEAQSALPDLEALYEHGGFPEGIRKEMRKTIDLIRGSQPADVQKLSEKSLEQSTAHGSVHPEEQKNQTFIPLSLVVSVTGEKKKTGQLPDVAFEDQDKNRLTYAGFFCQKPSIVVFFYTRCNNPNKCSLTITKLGRLQRLIQEKGLDSQLKTAAITYDPAYDLPARLKIYGLNRSVEFNEDHRFLRSLSGLHELQDYFGLGVNFNGSIVNQHRIELFLVDSQGKIARTFARLQWDIQEVLESAKTLIPVDINHP